MLKYRNFKLIKPNKDQVKRISKLIENHDGSIFHEVDLNRIVENAFQTDLYYLVNNPEEIACFSPVHITKNKSGLKRYNFKPLYDIPYTGFVGVEKIDINKLSVGLFESIKYTGFPYVKDRTHNYNDSLIFGETCMVDLSLDEDVIFSRMSHSKRKNIRKAIKNGIEVKKFHTEDGMNLFWPILEQLHNTLGSNDLTLEYYKKYLRKYGDSKQACLLIAYKEKAPISGLFILGNKNYMHCYKAASLFDVKREGQGELLHWEAIKYSKSNGIKYFDLGNLNKEKLPGIYSFKTGISNNIVNYPIYSKNKFGYQIINRIKDLL